MGMQVEEIEGEESTNTPVPSTDCSLRLHA